MTTEKQRNQTLDILRGVAIFIVVIAHAMQYSILPGEESILWMRFIRPFQMPLLFLISGWVLAFSFPPKSHLKFLRKKTERLFIPYIVWAVILYVVTLATTSSATFSLEGLGTELLVSDFWFLRALFLMYVVVWVGLFIREKWFADKSYFPILTVIVGLGMILLIRKIDILRPTANGWFYQWFLTGYLAHIITNRYQERILSYLDRHKTGICTICGIVLSGIAVCVYFVDLSQNLVAYLTIPSISLSVILTARYLPASAYRLLKHWGTISLAIYAIHACLFIPTSHWLVNLYPKCPYSVRICVLTIVWLVGCEAVNRLLNKTKLTRYLFLGTK